MAVLKNARHELFAQSVASGSELNEAYVKAGFKPNNGNSSTLNQKTTIQNRIREILSQRNRKILEKSAREVEVTREKILADLEEARQVAKKARNGSAMAMASLGMAKVQGLIIDRREVGDVGAFTSMTDEELLAEARKRAEALGLPPPDGTVLAFPTGVNSICPDCHLSPCRCPAHG